MAASIAATELLLVLSVLAPRGRSGPPAPRTPEAPAARKALYDGPNKVGLQLDPVRVRGWSDDESAVAYEIRRGVPFDGESSIVDRDGGVQSLRLDHFWEWLETHRARPASAIGPVGVSARVFDESGRCAWHKRVALCTQRGRIRFLVQDAGGTRVSISVANSARELIVEPWWSPSEKSIAWVISAGPGVPESTRYTVRVGMGSSAGVVVPEHFKGHDTFRASATPLGWTGEDAFVYRNVESDGLSVRTTMVVVSETETRSFTQSEFQDLGGMSQDERIVAGRNNWAAFQRSHPLEHGQAGTQGTRRVLSADANGQKLPSTAFGIAYPRGVRVVHLVVNNDAGQQIAERAIEVGDEGGELAPQWSPNGRALVVLDWRWINRFSGSVRLSDGQRATPCYWRFQ